MKWQERRETGAQTPADGRSRSRFRVFAAHGLSGLNIITNTEVTPLADADDEYEVYRAPSISLSVAEEFIIIHVALSSAFLRTIWENLDDANKLKQQARAARLMI